MKLLYIDESGSTGLDMDNKQQPYFILAGVCVEDKKWHEINDYFEEEKIKICSDFKDIEIHTNELFNTNKKSHFYKNNWKYNLAILEKLVNLVSNMNIPVSNDYLKKIIKNILETILLLTHIYIVFLYFMKNLMKF